MSHRPGVLKSSWLRVGLIFLSPFLLLALVITVSIIGSRNQLYHLQHLDHVRLLSACREVIANRHSYPDEQYKRNLPIKPDFTWVNPPFPTNLPVAIREVHPVALCIGEDVVQIYLFAFPFTRASVLGFKADAKQYGTIKYIDGLWFYNGNDSTKNVASRTNASVN